jgi:hypothetical protein
MADSTRVVVEVVAGLIPGSPEPEFSRSWSLSSDEWQAAVAAGKQGETLAVLNGRAQGYAGWLMMLPDRLNWVRVDWIWL